MKRLFFCLLLFSLNTFSNNDSQQIPFNNISFEEFKIQNNSQFEINQIFKKQKVKSLFEGTTLNNLVKRFSNTNHLSLKIKRANEKENELKISFSKSSLAIKYMLD
tara:strand:- start:72 stop:389 length:318 start_codon:yes stop_codon:yes gene_type:complete